MAKVLTQCPVCEATLHVSELACTHCGSSIRSRFETCRFCRLAPEHLAFVELFLRNEGNLSRVGTELGSSYPTVRNKLTAALAALGFDEPENESENNNRAGNETETPDRVPAVGLTQGAKETKEREPYVLSPEMLERRRIVLESLALGAITAEEAADALRNAGI